METNLQHFLESRTSKESSDTILQSILNKVFNIEDSHGTLIYIYGEPATGKTTLSHVVSSLIPDLVQILNLSYGKLDPKKKIIFVDEVQDGGIHIKDKLSKLVGSGYLVFLLSNLEPRIPADHTVVFEYNQYISSIPIEKLVIP